MQINEIPQNANPLDLDYSSVEIKRAVLAGGLPYELHIRKCEVQQYGPTTKHAGDSFIYLELANARPATGPTGDSITAGQVVIFDRINLKPYGKQTMAQVNESIARLQQALGLNMPLRQALQQANGKVIWAKVKLSPAGTSPTTGKSFPERNEIDYYMKQPTQ